MDELLQYVISFYGESIFDAKQFKIVFNYLIFSYSGLRKSEIIELSGMSDQKFNLLWQIFDYFMIQENELFFILSYTFKKQIHQNFKLS